MLPDSPVLPPARPSIVASGWRAQQLASWLDRSLILLMLLLLGAVAGLIGPRTMQRPQAPAASHRAAPMLRSMTVSAGWSRPAWASRGWARPPWLGDDRAQHRKQTSVLEQKIRQQGGGHRSKLLQGAHAEDAACKCPHLPELHRPSRGASIAPAQSSQAPVPAEHHSLYCRRCAMSQD